MALLIKEVKHNFLPSNLIKVRIWGENLKTDGGPNPIVEITNGTRTRRGSIYGIDPDGTWIDVLFQVPLKKVRLDYSEEELREELESYVEGVAITVTNAADEHDTDSEDYP